MGIPYSDTVDTVGVATPLRGGSGAVVGSRVGSDIGPARRGRFPSAPIDDRFYSDSVDVRLLARGLTGDVLKRDEGERAKPTSVTDRAQLEAAVGCLLVNLVRIRASGVATLGVYRDTSADWYRFGKIKFAAMRRALDGLEACGYVETVSRGYWDRAKKEGKSTRIQATEKLIEQIEHYAIGPGDILTRERQQLVELRRPKADATIERGQSMPWPRDRNDAKKVATKNLGTINEAIGRTCIALHVPDSTLEAIQDKHARWTKASTWTSSRSDS